MQESGIEHPPRAVFLKPMRNDGTVIREAVGETGHTLNGAVSLKWMRYPVTGQD